MSTFDQRSAADRDDEAVDQFASAMKLKLAAKRAQGYGGWDDREHISTRLARMLIEHVDKGDPVDIADIAMMIHQRDALGIENMHIANNGKGPTIIGFEAAQRFDLARHLRRQMVFSLRTFGPGMRTAGVVDHIRRELIEIEAAPADLAEWIDVIILAFDGAWRTGADAQAIITALVAKQEKNEARAWPDWRTADPDKAIEHVRPGEPTAPPLGQAWLGKRISPDEYADAVEQFRAQCDNYHETFTDAGLAAFVAHLFDLASSTHPADMREQADAVIKAAREWFAERPVTDWCEADLMKAIITLDGDWPGCADCDHECGEPCVPATVRQMHDSIDNQIAQLVHDGKLLPYEGYEPPAGFKPDTSRRRQTRPWLRAGIPGADLAFFTELRAIIIDQTRPLGNRLQDVDARIANLSGAPQPAQPPSPAPPAWPREPRSPEEAICDQARVLTGVAAALGLVLTIERRPVEPLAMGNAEYVIETRPLRGAA